MGCMNQTRATSREACFGPESVQAARDALLRYMTGTIDGDGPRAFYDTASDRALAAAVAALDREALTRTINAACFDPGRYVPRRSAESDFGGKDYESLDSWRARAAVAAAFPTECEAHDGR